jgi:hypothetical protein
MANGVRCRVLLNLFFRIFDADVVSSVRRDNFVFCACSVCDVQ